MPDDAKRVYLCQLKCLNNHCILGAYDVYEDMAEAVELKKFVEAAFERGCAEGVLNRECGICHSMQIYAQIDRTRFRTKEEAKPYIDAAKEAQTATRAFFRESRN